MRNNYNGKRYNAYARQIEGNSSRKETYYESEREQDPVKDCFVCCHCIDAQSFKKRIDVLGLVDSQRFDLSAFSLSQHAERKSLPYSV